MDDHIISIAFVFLTYISTTQAGVIKQTFNIHENVSIVQSPSTINQTNVLSMLGCAAECANNPLCCCATYGQNICILESSCFPMTSNATNVNLLVKSNANDYNASSFGDWIMFNWKLYYFSEEAFNFADANVKCKSMNGYLAEPRIWEEIRFLKEIARSFGSTFWLGGSDQVEENKWMWMNSQLPIELFDWSQWGPNNYNNQDCLTIHVGANSNYEWNDEHCWDIWRYACEKIL